MFTGASITKRETLDVILERVFEAVDVNGVAQEIKLQQGEPYVISEPNNGLTWRCPFQIVGIGSEKIHEAPGIDSLDALLVSLRIAEDHITSYAKRSQKRITWLNKDDLGLYTLRVPKNEEQTQSGFDAEDVFKGAFDDFFQNGKPKDDL
jgi:hypothetical protein